jgi:hypothetical protein
MSSLKLFIPKLALALEANTHTLYERQRVLVREGLLPSVDGRGPGSGVRLTPTTVAVLLISYLATDALAESGLATRALAQARRIDQAPIGPSGKTFKAAIVNVLSDGALASEIFLVRVGRTFSQATIYFGKEQIHFAGPKGTTVPLTSPHDFWVEATMTGRALERIRKALAETTLSTPRRSI